MSAPDHSLLRATTAVAHARTIAQDYVESNPTVHSALLGVASELEALLLRLPAPVTHPKLPSMMQLFMHGRHPLPKQHDALDAVRLGGLNLAELIMEHCPAGPDQSAAIRKVREAIWTANAAIMLEFPNDE